MWQGCLPFRWSRWRCARGLFTALADQPQSAQQLAATLGCQERGVQMLLEAKNETAVRVHITNQGSGKPINDAATSDLEAILAGEQSPRGWGLFLIKNMVDEMNIQQDDRHHTIELIVKFAEIGE